MGKLFIIDDNEDILISLEHWFKRKGYAVDIFQDSKTLLNALKETVPDVILLDVNLKGEDGREICKKLKDELHLIMPVILVSANSYALDNYTDHCANDLIHKPFDLDNITKVVDAHAGMKKQ